MSKSKETKRPKVPAGLEDKFSEIVNYIEACCRAHLNEEYEALAVKLTAKLARKRPSPLVSGRSKTWACGVLYTLADVNFLFDRSKEPYMSASQLCEFFDVGKSTGNGKGKLIRDMFKIRMFDHRWTLPSRMEENSFAWHISVNGFIIDARNVPLEIQEIAYQKGLIPYIPANKEEE